MATATNQYQPDYAVAPGWIIEERLAALDISHAELARRCGRSPKLISEIISGKAPIAPKTALQFEKVIGLDASIWLGIRSRLSVAPGTTGRSPGDRGVCGLGQTFPIRELTRRNAIGTPSTDGQAVSALLGVTNILRCGVNLGLARQVREGQHRLPALAELQERRVGAGDVAPVGRDGGRTTALRRLHRNRVQASARTSAATDPCSSYSGT